MSGDARGYSWPPFEPGNTMAERHGAYSPRKVDPLAADLVERITGQLDWIRPADGPALWAWARAEARVQLVSEWLAAQATGDRPGDLEDDGAVRPAAALLDRLEARAESLRSKLGLDPLSRARLGRDTAAGRVDVLQAQRLGALADQGRHSMTQADVPDALTEEEP